MRADRKTSNGTNANCQAPDSHPADGETSQGDET
jgi:hypothetical protein